MNKFSEYLRSDALYHVLVWLLLIVPHAMFTYFIAEQISLSMYLFNLAASDGLLLVVVYLNVFYLIRKYYRSGMHLQYFSILGIMTLGYIFASIYLNEYVFSHLGTKEPRSLFHGFFFNFFYIARYLVLAFLLYGLQEKLEQKKLIDQIQMEKLTTEINYLRAQINPHFLFNTLNNLYGLALEKSDKTPEIIIKLSQMMDFMLYELDGSKVPLRKDTENLENFIAIERIRQGNNARIEFVKKGEIEEQMIEPLLMLPLVENAFKHGVNQLIEGAYLTIELTTQSNRIEFTVRNNYRLNQGGEKQIHGSIGLSNLKKRLELFYRDNYTLNVTSNATEYQVNLTVNLT